MKASAVILALLFSGVQSIKSMIELEGRPDGIINKGHNNTPNGCVCTTHPQNYLGNFRTTSETACIQSCYDTPGCVMANFTPKNYSNCHKYSAICPCRNNPDQYQIVMDKGPTCLENDKCYDDGTDDDKVLAKQNKH